MNDYTGFLFARPNALEGAGRILDFGNQMSQYNVSKDGHTADGRALTADLQAVAADLQDILTKQGTLIGAKSKK